MDQGMIAYCARVNRIKWHHRMNQE
jgi:hypothetical protein